MGVCRNTMPGFDLQIEPEICTEGETGTAIGSAGSGETGSLSSRAGAGSTAGELFSAQVEGVSVASESSALQTAGRNGKR